MVQTRRGGGEAPVGVVCGCVGHSGEGGEESVPRVPLMPWACRVVHGRPRCECSENSKRSALVARALWRVCACACVSALVCVKCVNAPAVNVTRYYPSLREKSRRQPAVPRLRGAC